MAKSIIDIELKAEAFEKFAALFKQYDERLSKMPGKWGKVGEAADAAAASMNDSAEALERAAKATDDLDEAQDKAVKKQEKFNKHARDTERTFSRIGGVVGNIRKNISDTTQNLLKLGMGTLAGGGLLAAGGAFSVASLASFAGDTRRQATGLGVSAPELKAAQTSYQRFLDVDRTLGSISEAQADVSKQWAFSSIGLDKNKSAAALIPELLRKAGQLYAEDPATAAARLKARGFGELGVGVEEARRANEMRDEINLAERRNNKTAEQLKLQDKTLEKWQLLDVTIEESKNSIKDTFITAMAPLIPTFESLTKSFTAESARNIKDFFTSINELIEGVKPIVAWLEEKGAWISQYLPGKNAATTSLMSSANEWANKNIGKTPGDAMQRAVNFFTGKGWSAEEAAAITGNITQESGMNPQAKNPSSKMQGLAQWDSNRRRDFENWAGFPITDSRADFNKQLEFINYELTQGKEKRAGAALKQAVGLEAKTQAFENTYERAGGADMSKRLGYANAAYAAHINSLRRNGVQVAMYNNTGGSATAVIGAAATPDLGYSAFAGQ